MRNFAKLLIAALVAVTGLAATLQPATSLDIDPSGSDACDLEPRGALSVNEVDDGISAVGCDLVGRVIKSPNGTGVTVPEPGLIAGVSSTGPDGQNNTFQVAVSKAGVLTYPKQKVARKAASGGAAASADPSECTDTEYALTGVKAYGTYKWYIGPGALPAGMSQDTGIRVFRDALRNIINGRNNCKLPDQISAVSSFQRKAVSRSNISNTGVCSDRDTYSIWDAGDLNTGSLAVTCWWARQTAPGRPNRLVEADVKFNIVDHNFTNRPTTNCSGKYDVRGVATHEAGHVFGLGHVGKGHSNLTMYTTLQACTAKARSLGRGDLRGLQVLY